MEYHTDVKKWKAGDIIRFKTLEEFALEFGGSSNSPCSEWGEEPHQSFDCEMMVDFCGLSGDIKNLGGHSHIQRSSGEYDLVLENMEIILYETPELSGINNLLRSWLISSDMLINLSLLSEVKRKKLDSLFNNINSNHKEFDETLI